MLSVLSLSLRTEYHYVSDNMNLIAFKAVMHFSGINLAIPFTATVEIPTIEFAMIAIHLSPVSGAMLLVAIIERRC